MPRVRSHWAVLGQVRRTLAREAPVLAAHLDGHRPELYAGAVAPDALRLFAGRDKHSSHFYDDQRPDTWDSVLDTLTAEHPAVADAAALTPPQRAWMAGYLAHIATDVAYWRHVLSRLPPFPEHAAVHHGAWMLADALPLPHDERRLDPAAVDYLAAPPWVDAPAVRRLLDRMTGRLLLPDGVWATELAYVRGRPEDAARSDDDLLREHMPAWEVSVAQAGQLLPPELWREFQHRAVEGSVATLRRYLGGVDTGE
jgi:hypothetical protein